MNLLKVALFFFVSVLTACSGGPAPETTLIRQFPSPLPQIMRNDEGVFRGITLGMDMKNVRTLTGDSNLTQAEPNYLFFEDSVGKKDHFTYDFIFDSLGLKEMNLDVYQPDSTDSESLLGQFKGYFTKKYGVPAEAKDMLIWSIPGQKRTTELAMYDESIDYGYGKLTLSFYDKKLAGDPLQAGDSTDVPLK